MANNRIAPHDLDAEEAVLGSCLIDSEAIGKIEPFLKAEYFYRDKNIWVYEAVLSLFKRNEAINQVTVAHELRRNNRIESLGGPDYLSNLILNTPTSVHVKYYADIVHKLAGHRAIGNLAGTFEQVCYNPRPSMVDALSEIEKGVQEVRGEYTRSEDWTVYHEEGLRDYQEAQLEAKLKPWLTTPWENYNEMCRYRNGKVVTIAGPSSMGKTMMVEQCVEHVARDLGRNGLFMFTELDPCDFQNRRACRLMVTDSGKSPTMHELEDGVYANNPKMLEYLDSVSQWKGKVTMVPIAGWPISRICAEIRLKAMEGLADAVFIDYIQLIPREGVTRYNVTDARAIGIVIQMLKTTCQNLPNQPPLILVSQVNRTLKTKEDCSINVLRESGEIAEYSNIVTIVFSLWDSTKGSCVQKCVKDRKTSDPFACYQRCVHLVTVKNTFGPKGEVLVRQIPYRYLFISEDGHKPAKQVAEVFV